MKVVLIFRETGSEYSCKWCYTSGIYNIILGGHTHVKREGEYRRKNRQKNRIKCCEVAKFLARDTADYLNYGILTIDEKHNMEYKFYTTKFNSRGNNNG